MIKDIKMRFFTVIMSFLWMTNTLFGSDTLALYPVKSIDHSGWTSLNLHHNKVGDLVINKHSQIGEVLGEQLDDYFHLNSNNNLAGWDYSSHSCTSITPLFTSALIASHSDANVQLTYLQTPNSMEGPTHIELAVPPPGDCPLLEALAKDLADPDKGPALNAYLDELLTEGSVRVKAWEALIDLPLLRTNVTKLQAVSDFADAKNIDPSLVKTELQSLPGFKDDLIKGFEVSNGTTPFPKIINKGDISTTGSLHGSFINGQFVPNGNALPNGIMDFVALPNGQILLGTKHTFLSQGADVLAAGTVKLTDGVVKDITNLSGHYLPNPGVAMNFLRVFKNAGVNIDQSFLSIYKENGTIFKQIHINANARKLYE